MKKKYSRGYRIPHPFSDQDRFKVTSALKEEEILIFPTETVYGLGGNALSPKVIEKIYALKKRTPGKLFPVLVNKLWLDRLAPKRSNRINKLIQAFWPGPLTLIFPVHTDLPKSLTGGEATLALRWSNSKVVQELITLGNCPLIGTSANISGHSESLSLDAVEEQLKVQIPLLIDGGKLEHNPPSSLLDCKSENFRLLRTGSLSLTDLKPFL